MPATYTRSSKTESSLQNSYIYVYISKGYAKACTKCLKNNVSICLLTGAFGRVCNFTNLQARNSFLKYDTLFCLHIVIAALMRCHFEILHEPALINFRHDHVHEFMKFCVIIKRNVCICGQ